MNKIEFVKEVAKRCMLSDYAVEEVFNTSSSLAAEKLICGEEVEIPKLGRFTLVERKPMQGKNLFGNPELNLEKCIYPTFKIATGIKNRIKNGCKYQKACR